MIHDASSVATPIHIIVADRLLRQYEEDRREELIVKRQERERTHSRQLIEDYLALLTLNDIGNRKRMGGTLGFGTINQIFSRAVAGILTPVESTDKNGNNLIRCEHVSRTMNINQNRLDNLQFHDILAKLGAQTEFNYNLVKFMEERQLKIDLRDEALVQMFSDRDVVSNANNPKAEQLSIEHESKIVSRLLPGVKGKKDDRPNGQEVETPRKKFGQNDFVNSSSSYCEMSSNITPLTPPPPPIDMALLHSKNTTSHILSTEPKPFGTLNEDDEKGELFRSRLWQTVKTTGAL